jgi:hypothetical protein
MTLTQEKRTYITKAGAQAILRILKPSQPHGAWPGNRKEIREWSICPQGQVSFERPSDSVMVALERELHEIRSIAFINHPTIGRCVLGGLEAGRL